jgi:hypothetical protein
MRRRWVDDEDDLSAFDPKYLAQGRRVYKDGYGPRVALYMTDSAPSRRRPTFDGVLHKPGPVIDALQGRSAISDAVARQRVSDSYEAYCRRLEDGWLWRKGHVRASVAVGDSPRDAWIKRQASDWRRGPVRYDLDPYRSAGNTTMTGRSTAGPATGGLHPDEFQWNASTASQYRTPRPDDDDDDNGLDMTATDPEGGDDDYTRSLWSAQNAIRSGSRQRRPGRGDAKKDERLSAGSDGFERCGREGAVSAPRRGDGASDQGPSLRRDVRAHLQRLAESVIPADVLAKLPEGPKAKALLIDGLGADGLDQARSAQARLNQIKDAADPNVERLRAIVATGNHRHEELSGLVNGIIAFVRSVPDTMALSAVTPAKASGGDPASALVVVRKAIAEATIALSKVKSAPPPKAEIKAGLAAYVHGLIKRAKPRLKIERGKPFEAVFADGQRDFGPSEAWIAGLAAWTDREKFTAALEALADEISDARAIPTAEQTKRIAALEAELLKLGFEEEAIIEAAFASGVDLLRRGRADPRAVLGVAIAEAAPLAAAAE